MNKEYMELVEGLTPEEKKMYLFIIKHLDGLIDLMSLKFSDSLLKLVDIKFQHCRNDLRTYHGDEPFKYGEE